MEQNFSIGLEDPKFAKQLESVCAELRNKVETTKKAFSGKVKASPLLRLVEGGQLNADFVKSEFTKIGNRESTLPSGQREVIKAVVIEAAKRSVVMTQRERAREIEAKANAKAQEQA